MRKAAVALVVLLLTAALPTPSAAAADPSFTVSSVAGGEIRAYWVDAFGPGIGTPAQIDQLVADVKAAKMNVIVAQVVRRGDCFCNRLTAAPRTEATGVDAAPFDPLQTLIDKAHANGIQVFAWMIATAIWRGDTPPADPQHPFNLHGTSATGAANWLTKRSDGAQRIPGNEDWMIDPGVPDAAQWIVDVATQLVANYAIDGVNLDRIRYPDGNIASEPSWGYNPVSVARFQQATGRTDIPSNGDPQWTQWRRDQVTGIVRRIYVESYAIRPSVRISADTITYGAGPQGLAGGFAGTRTYREVLQDWQGWMREGILDLNIPMNYKRQADARQAQWYRDWSDFAKDNAFGRQSVVGSALYLNSVSDSVAQARIAVSSSSAGRPSTGWVGYSYRTPDDLTNAGQRSGDASRAALTAALAPVFTSPASVPAMPWKTQPVVGQIHGTTTAGARVQLFNGANALIGTQTSDGKGWFGFVDVPAGTYRVTTNGVTIGTANVVAGRVADVAPQPQSACVSTSSIGPGIPPPANVPAGVEGFHAAWYGQSGYMTLCPGTTATATVAYYNSGSQGWLLGKMGEVAYLGTWRPEPGQDMASPLGGDGTLGSPDTDWPRYDRIAVQPSQWVGPNQVSWFQFSVKAPSTPGTYKLYLRPLIEGATWMEDYGVFWTVTVK